MTQLPTATTNKKLDMSKEPKTPLTTSQRHNLWMAVIIMGGIAAIAISMTYLIVTYRHG